VFRQEDISSLRNPETDGLIVVNDSEVLIWGKGCKELSYEFSVAVEFDLAVGKYEDCCIEVRFPCDGPIGMGSDSLSRSAGTDGNFEGTQLFLSSFIRPDGIYSGKNMIEVDETS
jgi:hypothetical protein